MPDSTSITAAAKNPGPLGGKEIPRSAGCCVLGLSLRALFSFSGSQGKRKRA